MRKHIFLILGLLAGLAACHNNKMVKIERKGEPNIYRLEDHDKEMNAVIAQARSSLDQFDKALESGQYDTGTFALKVRFETRDGGGEHIWATSITKKDGGYYGIIDNLPDLTTQVKEGERIPIKKEDISDWMYSDKGVLRGGYTIRLIRSRMSKTEQEHFDKEIPFKIE